MADSTSLGTASNNLHTMNPAEDPQDSPPAVGHAGPGPAEPAADAWPVDTHPVVSDILPAPDWTAPVPADQPAHAPGAALLPEFAGPPGATSTFGPAADTGPATTADPHSAHAPDHNMPEVAAAAPHGHDDPAPVTLSPLAARPIALVDAADAAPDLTASNIWTSSIWAPPERAYPSAQALSPSPRPPS